MRKGCLVMKMAWLTMCAVAAVSLHGAIEVLEPANGAEVATLSDGQKSYLSLPHDERIAFFADPAKRDAMCKLTGCPKPIKVVWRGGESPYEVSIRRLPDRKVFFRRMTSEKSVFVDNLEIARRYEIEVRGGEESVVSSFSTEDLAPRLIRVPGVPNVRDLGGWKTLDGRRIRQGRVLRMAGLNSNADAIGMKSGRTRVTTETRDVLLSSFGIKSDIDLRSDKECLLMTGSPLGPDVTWFHMGSEAYGGINSRAGRDAFATVFRIFLDEENYPIAFHCIGGKDRTGTVAFILGALLGMVEEDLYRDWEATGFWLNERDFIHRTRFDKLVRTFNRFPGETLNARVVNYVRMLGFKDSDIEKFRKMMLEG